MGKEVLKSSFAAGTIALVFLVVGYQAALFVHSAAVARIAADRDCPDTVFLARVTEEEAADAEGGAARRNVSGGTSQRESGKKGRNNYNESGKTSRGHDGSEDGSGGSEKGNWKVVERRSGAKSEAGKTVREKVPRRKVESFRFDPNSVSVEELQRLGFSLKQAQSIDNYRLKGGRFHRKSDFAKSFVVSDSIYRRLEPYIDIPRLDLNTADSAAFDALPGIGGYFARKMVEYRGRLGGSYSYPEQLLEIKNFDRDKFDALSDLIQINPRTQAPYPLWALPEDDLRRHPYIGPAAHGVVLWRESQPREKWSVEELKNNRILSEENAGKLSRCLLAPP